jgi:hypothetical protein
VDMPHHRHRSHLFAVRLWLEALSDGRAEWRGEVQYVETGETHYFRDWPTLIQSLGAMLPQPDADRRPGSPGGAAPLPGTIP